MKTICWNDELIIQAENEPESKWLFEYAKEMVESKSFDDYVEFEIGDFDWEGKLNDMGTMLAEEFRKEVKDGSFGEGFVYIETNHEEHTGNSGQVVKITINPRGF